VEVRPDDGTLLVLDCGTGAHDLGQALVEAAQGAPIHGSMLITHTHWDHIQGFPFFAPLFVPGSEWDIYAPGGLSGQIQATLAGQMQYTYFPVTLDQLAARIRYHELVEGAFEVGPVRVQAQYLNHPALALGYRLTVGSATMVYSTDHEPHSAHQAVPVSQGGSSSEGLIHLEDRRHAEFLSEADLVIHDAQYTAGEYADKVGWGHSTVEYSIDVARAAGVRRLALFHHDPLRDDSAVDRLLTLGQARADGRVQVLGAAEGATIDLAESGRSPQAQTGEIGAALAGPPDLRAEPDAILVVDDDPDIVRLLMVILRADGYRLTSASDGAAALATLEHEHPSLILLDMQMPGLDGLGVCRAVRASSDPQLRTTPIVMITAQSSAEDTQAGFAAGATDYLTKPFAPAHVRARVRGWLQRAIQAQ
jgi:CheY-like chemotaxis protein/ribonuclease BN (tRNA processing enzyme)